jgi:hypothetical protein
MYVWVRAGDSGEAEVTLEEPDDCLRFHLVCEVDPALLDAALVEANVGWLEDAETALIDPEAIVRASRDRVGPDWGERFSSMVEYAETKGWVNADGHLRAHVEPGAD